MILLRGTGVSGGIAAGRLKLFKKTETEIPRYKAMDSEKEWNRFDSARREAVRQIHELAEKAQELPGGVPGDDAAQILAAHEIMAMDPEYEEDVGERISHDHINAEAAVMDAARDAAARITAVDDEYMKARAADVEDVAQRIVAAMGHPEKTEEGTEPQSESVASEVLDGPVILAADDLAPSDTLRLDRAKILGFITAGGSASGHTAILARTMGIPAIIGTGCQIKPEYEGQEILMDGDTGEIVIAPDEQERARFLAKTAERQRETAELAALKGRKTVTKDGRAVRLYCNISFPADIPAVLDNDADGIGLFRSECLFLQRDSAPSEEEQFEAYRQVLSAMNGRRVIIRTLDAGSDKQADYLGLAAEANPALGNRGIRFSLSRPELFKLQLRALARASVYGNLGIMFPMVTSVWEVTEAKKLWREVQEELRNEGIAFDPETLVGIMIETPAAALLSDRLAEEADFFSIGTNDLTQYTLACDRQRGGEAAYGKMPAMSGKASQEAGRISGGMKPESTDDDYQAESAEKERLTGGNEPSVPSGMHGSAENASSPWHPPICDPRHPAVLRLIEMTVKNARGAGIPVGICGELAADQTMTEYFLSIGVDELSVPPRDILPLRRKIRAI